MCNARTVGQENTSEAELLTQKRRSSKEDFVLLQNFGLASPRSTLPRIPPCLGPASPWAGVLWGEPCFWSDKKPNCSSGSVCMTAVVDRRSCPTVQKSIAKRCAGSDRYLQRSGRIRWIRMFDLSSECCVLFDTEIQTTKIMWRVESIVCHMQVQAIAIAEKRGIRVPPERQPMSFFQCCGKVIGSERLARSACYVRHASSQDNDLQVTAVPHHPNQTHVGHWPGLCIRVAVKHDGLVFESASVDSSGNSAFVRSCL